MKYIVLITILFINSFFISGQEIDSFAVNGNYLQEIERLHNEKSNFKNLAKIGAIYQKSGNYRQAILYYKKALHLKPDKNIQLKLASLYAKNNQKENAIKLYNELIALNPNNLLLKYQLANLLYHTKQYKKSLLLFTELSKIDRKNSNFIYKLASIYRNLKKKDKAISLYKKVLQLDSLSGNSYYFIAKLYRKQKEIDSTNKYLNKGLFHIRKHILLNQLQAKVAFKAKDYQKVIKTVLLLDTLKRSTAFYTNLKGIAFYHNKEFKKALKVFNYLVLSKNIQDDTFYNLGLCYKALKDYANAEQFFNMAIIYKRPSIAQEYYQIALLYKEQNKPQKAIAFLKKSLEEKYQNPDVLYETALLTDTYYKDKSIALKYYEDFISYYEGYYPNRTAYALQQIQKIKTNLFLHKK